MIDVAAFRIVAAMADAFALGYRTFGQHPSQPVNQHHFVFVTSAPIASWQAVTGPFVASVGVNCDILGDLCGVVFHAGIEAQTLT